MAVIAESENAVESSVAVLELIARRWSPKDFSERPVEPEKLASLFEAARTAPSSYNEQPWRFIVATRDDAVAFERLLSTLAAPNAAWAKHAPVLILSVAKLDFTRNGQPNRHAFHDVGQAAAYLTLQATSLGLSVHQMGGFDGERAARLLNIPSGYAPVAVMAVGYREASRDTTSAALQRSRRAVEELVFSGTWGESSNIF
jgi:nitroreductase